MYLEKIFGSVPKKKYRRISSQESQPTSGSDDDEDE